MQTVEANTAAKPLVLPSPWTARIGLAVVGAILVSCFGLLIAASHASTIGQ